MNALTLNIPFSIKWRRSLWGTCPKMLFWQIALPLLLALLVCYIFQIQKLTQAAYLARAHEQRISTLANENQDLEIKFAKQNSLANIEALIQSLNFEPVGKMHFIRIPDTTVVTK